jgi:phage-related protein
MLKTKIAQIKDLVYKNRNNGSSEKIESIKAKFFFSSGANTINLSNFVLNDIELAEI